MLTGKRSAYALLSLSLRVQQLATVHSMDWSLSYDTDLKRIAILVSKDDHCL